MTEQVPSRVCSEHRSVAPSDTVLNFPSTSDFRDVSGVDTQDYASGVDAHDLRDSLYSPLRELRAPSLEIEGAPDGPRSQYKCSHCGAMCSHEEASAMQKKHAVPENLQHDMNMVAAPEHEMVDMVAAPAALLHLQGVSSPKESSGSQSIPGGGSIWTRFLTANRSQVSPLHPSFRALSGRLKFTVRRHTFNQSFSLLSG